VQKFANAAPALGGEIGWPALVWLTGLLEGEGTFLKPLPSQPNLPVISCRMTDLDVIELVARLFGTNLHAADKGQHRTEYIATIKGSRAVRLMQILRPMMGARRQQAIDRALDQYSPPPRKLGFALAEQIRLQREDGVDISSLAREFAVSRPTIRKVLNGRIYPVRDNFPWRTVSWTIRGATAAGTGLNWKELYWLAGWLEAEGSFCRPPPSAHRAPRVLAGSRDQDVIEEVARLLRVNARLARKKRSHWSDYWRLMLRGGRAITLMQAIAPSMGQRRTAQIDGAIAAARDAGAVLGWHERRARGAEARKQRRNGAGKSMEPARVERASSATSDRRLQV
jgi:hypothetical protein